MATNMDENVAILQAIRLSLENQSVDDMSLAPALLKQALILFENFTQIRDSHFSFTRYLGLWSADAKFEKE